MVSTPSLLEEHISKIPALQLLINLGYIYLSPNEALELRRKKKRNVILDDILESQLKKINSYTTKGRQYKFSPNNIKKAIQVLKDFPPVGLVHTSELAYTLLTIGKSFEETVESDTKSYNINYIDWNNINNNVFHVTEEFQVEKTGSEKTCRPDIVLFVNGIPFVVIECKRPDLNEPPIKQAISQQVGNQRPDYIPNLFIYTSIILAVTSNEAKYGTTGTAAEFWAKWEENDDNKASVIINKPLSLEQKNKLFVNRKDYVRSHFDALETSYRLVNEQDKTIYSLCRPERLLELSYKYIVFDEGEKKICRYQQYFAITETLERIKNIDNEGRRSGGLVWHTQGSGKSLTMVMLAKAISLEPDILNPKVILVTDRIDLDQQIYDTFVQCRKKVSKAKSGQDLIKLITSNKADIITTVIDKFESAADKEEIQDTSNNIFVLVDESHRSQYGSAHAKMKIVFTKACYIGFTGTPLMKKDKSTANKFGGIIHKYTIDQAVQDNAVVPLLYEGRHTVQDVNQTSIDRWFENISKSLNEKQKADLKKKFSSVRHLNVADKKIELIAFDISNHFSKNWKGTPFKAQLTAPSKDAALKYKKYMDEFDMVTSEVVISGPDIRDDYENIYDEVTEEVQIFWKKMMAKYGNEREYNRSIIDSFKRTDHPDIIIVVDKLLTGFDAPKNTILYITRSLKEHTLLQAIARVNRLYEGKDYGYIIDYYGILGDLDEALTNYSSLSDFDEEDIAGSLTNILEKIKTLPQKHSELWDVFKDINNKLDQEAYEQILGNELFREKFYDKLSSYARILSIALSSIEFNEQTSKEKIDKYKSDLQFFLRLRISVKSRYSDSIDYREYEKKIQKLIDNYVISDEIMQITDLVNIFDKEKFEEEVAKHITPASKADTIASRTIAACIEKMDEDPAFYTKFSKMIQNAIEDYKNKRISELECLRRVSDANDAVRNRADDSIPDKIRHMDVARSFYGVTYDTFRYIIGENLDIKGISADTAIRIDQIIQSNIVVDWTENNDIKNKMITEVEDYLLSIKELYEIPITFDNIDMIIEKSLSIANSRYYR